MGRTAEEIDQIKQLKEVVLFLAKKHNVTYYEVGNNTTVSQNTVKKIFNGVTIMPGLKILKTIETYILDKYENQAVAEPKSEYAQTPTIMQELEKMNIALKNIEDKIDKYDLKNELMFEILLAGKSEEVKVLNDKSKALKG